MSGYFNEFDKYRFEKRSKISTMDSIIRNNTDLTDSEEDVLLRGYIVLIYAFWEGSYKKLANSFFNFFKYRKINELPHTIKNQVIIELSTEKSDKNIKINEVNDYRKFLKINEKININLEKKLLECEGYDKTEKYFKEETGNPNYSKLDILLKKYCISLDKLISELISENNMPNNFKDVLEFIVSARNSIAHGDESRDMHDGYKNYIVNKFLNNNEKGIIDASDFLRETVFYLNMLFITIIDKFKDKYMHEEEKML